MRPEPSSSDLGPAAVPPVPQSFPEIQGLSVDELYGLCADPAKYAALASSILAKSRAVQVRDGVLKANRDTAQATVAKAAELAEVRNHIAIIRSSEYSTAKASFDELHARQAAVLAQLQPARLGAALAEAANAAEADSKEVYDKFVSEGGRVEAFVEAYRKARILYHRRDLKCQAAAQAT